MDRGDLGDGEFGHVQLLDTKVFRWDWELVDRQRRALNMPMVVRELLAEADDDCVIVTLDPPSDQARVRLIFLSRTQPPIWTLPTAAQQLLPSLPSYEA
jgi:hypothetical protein